MHLHKYNYIVSSAGLCDWRAPCWCLASKHCSRAEKIIASCKMWWRRGGYAHGAMLCHFWQVCPILRTRPRNFWFAMHFKGRVLENLGGSTTFWGIVVLKFHSNINLHQTNVYTVLWWKFNLVAKTSKYKKSKAKKLLYFKALIFI